MSYLILHYRVFLIIGYILCNIVAISELMHMFKSTDCGNIIEYGGTTLIFALFGFALMDLALL